MLGVEIRFMIKDMHRKGMSISEIARQTGHDRKTVRKVIKGSIILTSNKSYGEWGSIFSDTVLAAAILDRLLHTSTTVNIRGQSYRLREKRQAGIFTDLPDLSASAQKE